MQLSKPSTPIGFFALLLAVLVLSLIGSLIAADRALARAERRGVELDARGTAILAERELRLQSTGLRELFGPLLTPRAREELTVPSGFQSVWVLDTVWRVQATAPPTADPSTEVSSLAAATRSLDLVVRALPSPSDSTSGGLLVAIPLSHRGRRLGSAVGMISGRKFLASLAPRAPDRMSVTLRSRGRAIATTGAGSEMQRAVAASALLQLPGDTIAIAITHPREGELQRTALWAVGVAALIALVAALARERRQALRVAVRSAELEHLYQEVARSNRMKSEFLANISHELRTPLNAIVGFVEMLREGVYGELSPRQALPVDRIAASAGHLRQLVDRLLDIAKIAAGRVDIHVEPLVLRPFVLNVAAEMESLVAERGLSLSIAVGQSLPRIRTDQTHLRQILINLIGNAVKYTATGGVHIRARLSGDGATPPEEDAGAMERPPDPLKPWIAVQVSDTGVGIPREDLERIFDEFEQVNAGPRTDSARRGTGLGLAISRRLARLLGGEITVVSDVGRGSTFTVWLPVDAAELAAGSQPTSVARSSA